MDWQGLRADFPVLNKKFNGKPIVYFDNACVSLKPRQVVEAMNEYYYDFTACHGRSLHKFAHATTEHFEAARAKIAKFIGAGRPQEVIFTKNTTEGINLVANALSFKEGGLVLTTDTEHNSNLIPWQKVSKTKGIVHKTLSDEKLVNGDLSELEEKLSLGRARLVSLVHTSNVTGMTLPAKEIAMTVHKHGALLLLDCAQSIPHMPINVRDIDADFVAFSGHKMCGPSGTGVLYGKYSLLESPDMEQFIVGGETVIDSTYTTYTIDKPPAKFEAGLQNYAGAIGLGAAADYLTKIGMKNVEARGHELAGLLIPGVQKLPKVKLLSGSDPSKCCALANFIVDGMDAHDIAIILDEVANIFVRSGRHCVHSWYNAQKLPSSVRPSLYFYNTEDETRLFLDVMAKVIKDLA